MWDVIIVEDEYYIRERLKVCLDWKALGCRIAGEAADGEDAVDLLRTVSPHIALVDINIPIINGLVFIKLAMQSHPGLKVIIVSGYSDFEYARTAIRLGVENYLLKPLKREELHECILKITQSLQAEQKNPLSAGPPPLPSPLRPGAQNSRAGRIVAAANQYIEGHYSEPLSLTDIANALFLNASYLSYVYKKETGQGVCEHLRDWRMEKAKELLDQGIEIISDVALKVGYYDQHYFSKCFKRCYGCSPTQYLELRVTHAHRYA